MPNRVPPALVVPLEKGKEGADLLQDLVWGGGREREREKEGGSATFLKRTNASIQ